MTHQAYTGPFIVTTKRVGIVHGADGQEGPFEATLSRVAVATLEEAKSSARACPKPCWVTWRRAATVKRERRSSPPTTRSKAQHA